MISQVQILAVLTNDVVALCESAQDVLREYEDNPASHEDVKPVVVKTIAEIDGHLNDVREVMKNDPITASTLSLAVAAQVESILQNVSDTLPKCRYDAKVVKMARDLHNGAQAAHRMSQIRRQDVLMN